MICSGRCALTKRNLTVRFGNTIQEVTCSEEPAGDQFLSPGFVDLQVNGFAGVDFNSPLATLLEIARAIDTILATGVTRFLPTVITGPPADMLASLANLHRAQQELPRGRAMAGFHVEGPHIGPEDGPRGAHPARWVRPPDPDEFRRWQDVTCDNIRLVTLSPHWPDAPRYIETLVRAGVAVAIGHTSANPAQIAAAADAGATLSTHLGNAGPALVAKQPNLYWEQLADDRLSASFIADGIHLSDSFLRAAARAKGVDRTILVTDAAAPAGAAPGRYRLGELDVTLTPDDRVVLTGSQKLAGSALRMNRAISNLAHIARVPLADAVVAATLNPARIIGLTRGLVRDHTADLVVFNSSLEIRCVFLDGEEIPLSARTA